MSLSVGVRHRRRTVAAPNQTFGVAVRQAGMRCAARRIRRYERFGGMSASCLGGQFRHLESRCRVKLWWRSRAPGHDRALSAWEGFGFLDCYLCEDGELAGLVEGGVGGGFQHEEDDEPAAPDHSGVEGRGEVPGAAVQGFCCM